MLRILLQESDNIQCGVWFPYQATIIGLLLVCDCPVCVMCHMNPSASNLKFPLHFYHLSFVIPVITTYIINYNVSCTDMVSMEGWLGGTGAAPIRVERFIIVWGGRGYVYVAGWGGGEAWVGFEHPSDVTGRKGQNKWKTENNGKLVHLTCTVGYSDIWRWLGV